MQPATSDKTFHLKWNNHLQNLSQLFTTIYSSSALADVTLSCRDGSIRAHKLVLSACSPYFEQIFKDNPCKHPVIILKGIPYSEINQLVEFMYKGSVDVQELDLQSLMHTASELEIRGLAYEIRKDAVSSLLNVNLNEFPTFASTPNASREVTSPAFEPTSRISNLSSCDSTQRPANPYQTNLERLRQIHLYQQTMCRNTPFSQAQTSSTTEQSSEASAIKRKRKNEDIMPVTTTNAVKNILAAAAKELAEKKSLYQKASTCIQTEDDAPSIKVDSEEVEGEDLETEVPLHSRDTRFKGKKRVSVGLNSDYTTINPVLPKTKLGKKSVKFAISAHNTDNSGDGLDDSLRAETSGDNNTNIKSRVSGMLKCVDLDNLKESHLKSVPNIDDNDDSSALDTSDENNLLVETSFEYVTGHEEDYDSSDSKPGLNQKIEKIFKCDLCDLSYSRNSHMLRHRRTHTGERPFQCTACPFSFNRSSHLARHRRTHTGERPYRCEACGRCFARGDKLKLHMRICEKDEYILPSQGANADPNKQIQKELLQTTMIPGMVSVGHSERHQLMFTSSGEVMLAPRSETAKDTCAVTLNDSIEKNQSANASASDLNNSKMNISASMTPSSMDNSLMSSQYYAVDSAGYPIKRGRGRPRKKPLPSTDTPLIKKKRGRPPKVIKLDPFESSSVSMENYTASNLPYGDFSYLTDIISTHFNQSSPQTYHNIMQLKTGIDGANSLGNVAQKPPTLSSMTTQSTIHNMDIATAQAAFRENIKTQNMMAHAARQLNSNDLTLKDKVLISAVGKIDNSKPVEIILPDLPMDTILQKPCLATSENTDNFNKSKSENTIDMHETMDISSQEAVSFGGKKIKSNVMMVGDCQIVKIQGAYESSKTSDNATKSEEVATVGECTIKPVL